MQDMSVNEALRALRCIRQVMTPAAGDSVFLRLAKTGFRLSIVALVASGAAVIIAAPGPEAGTS